MIEHQYKKNTGFTLVELMVAIAIFSIVMVVATSALMNVIDANNKARAIKVAINNVSLALEGLSKDMRMGTEYNCSNNGGVSYSVDCSAGGNTIRYRSIRADIGSDGLYKYAVYKYDQANNLLKLCIEKDSISCGGDTNFQALTSSEVKKLDVVFYVLGVANSLSEPPNRTMPRMIVTIKGTAGTKSKLETTFELQTSISQRNRPKTI